MGFVFKYKIYFGVEFGIVKFWFLIDKIGVQPRNF